MDEMMKPVTVYADISEDGLCRESTTAIEIEGVGCVVTTFTQVDNKNGSTSLSESSVFVPGASIVDGELCKAGKKSSKKSNKK